MLTCRHNRRVQARGKGSRDQEEARSFTKETDDGLTVRNVLAVMGAALVVALFSSRVILTQGAAGTEQQQIAALRQQLMEMDRRVKDLEKMSLSA